MTAGGGPSTRGPALRLGNPVALFGAIVVGLAAMLLPDVVLYVAITREAAPPLEAIRAGASIPFDVMGVVLVARQSLMLIGALAIAALARGAHERAPAARGGAVRELGFVAAPPIAIVAGALGVVGLGPMSDFLIRLLRSIAPGLEAGVLEQIEEITGAQPLWVLWPLLALLPGIAEEAYFRGLVQRVLGRGAPAIAGSAMIFAVFHLDPVQAVGVLPIGFYLAWLRERAVSLWVPIAAHVANNSAALFAARALPSAEVAAAAEPTPPLVAALLLGWTATAMVVVHRTTAGRRARATR